MFNQVEYTGWKWQFGWNKDVSQ